jgi:hypothetical protein
MGDPRLTLAEAIDAFAGPTDRAAAAAEQTRLLEEADREWRNAATLRRVWPRGPRATIKGIGTADQCEARAHEFERQAKETASSAGLAGGLLAALRAGDVIAFGEIDGLPSNAISSDHWSGDWLFTWRQSFATRVSPPRIVQKLQFIRAQDSDVARNPGGAGHPEDPDWLPIDNEFQKRLLKGICFKGAKGLYLLVREIAESAQLRQFEDGGIRYHFEKRFGRFGWDGLIGRRGVNSATDSRLGYWQKLDGGVILAIKNGDRPKKKVEFLQLYSTIAQHNKCDAPSLDDLRAHIVETLTDEGWDKFD